MVVISAILKNYATEGYGKKVRHGNLRKRMGQKKQISYYQCVIPILVVGLIVLELSQLWSSPLKPIILNHAILIEEDRKTIIFLLGFCVPEEA